jgi:spore coat polysaccharide biosynthesis predicted glycosyltransferase SpsG
VSAKTRLVVRADATPEAGAGHVLRCLALAERWRDDGGEVTFAGSWPEAIAGLLDAEGIRGVRIGASHPDPADLEGTLAVVSGASAVVIDGYGFDAPYHDAVAAKAGATLVIDDVGHLPRYGGDLLLNPGLGASRIGYRDAPARRLLGPEFALLRREVRALREHPREVAARGTTVLLALGGGRRTEDWRAILEALAAGPEGATFRLLPGFDRSRHAELARLAAEAGPRFRPSEDPAEAAELMARADLAVSAAGVTAIELAFLGVPSILVSVAENQRPTAAALAASGAAVDLGPRDEAGAETLRSMVGRLLASPDTRRDMRARGRALFDGRGVERVAAALRERTGPGPG